MAQPRMAKIPSSSFICTSASWALLRLGQPVVIEPSLLQVRSACPPRRRTAPGISRGSGCSARLLDFLGRRRISPCRMARALPAFQKQQIRMSLLLSECPLNLSTTPTQECRPQQMQIANASPDGWRVRLGWLQSARPDPAPQLKHQCCQ